MLFHSLQFAIFFPIVFGLYHVLPHTLQNRMLLVASYVFYGAWDWRYCSLLLISTVTDYFCGLGLARTDDAPPKRRKPFVLISVLVNLSLLGVFKYYDFFATEFQDLMGAFGLSVQPYFLNVVLPIGISFYTFQTMSYTIDVYRRKVDAAENFFDFALYVSFFPQLIAGPIERGTRLLPQILKPRTVKAAMMQRGAYFFVWGLFLKVFIADNMAAIVDPVFAATGDYEGGQVLLAVYAFSFQIYCDFAGYSFMAIGLAQSMGITLMENFRRPYFSRNIGDFWRRWHISLSSWFRDYVFSPFYLYIEHLNWVRTFPFKVRHGIAFFGTLVVAEYMLGLWHGAAWTFGLFGLYHAFMIWGYYYVRTWWDKMNPYVQIFLTYHVACGGWLIFRVNDMDQAVDMFKSLFVNFNISNPVLADMGLKIIAFNAILIIVQVFQDWKKDTVIVLRLPVFLQLTFLVFIVSLTMVFGDFSDRPFIYFQF